ncbi:MAG: DUF1800 family protein [Bryobacteraceae bacterium]|nr:DUF1800 family protein [Bryobacteraceae bacterium]
MSQFTFLASVIILLTSLPAAAQNIVVYHEKSTVETGTSRDFSAYVPLSPNTVVWSVNGVRGGNSTVGTVTGTGLRVIYKAPATAPANNVVRLTATSTAYPAKSGTAEITIVRPIPRIWSARPSSFPAGRFQVRLNGANFTRDAIALFNGSPVTAVYESPTSLLVSGTASTAGRFSILVRLPAPGGVTSGPVTVTVTAPSTPVQVTVNPATVSLQAGRTQSFSAAVTGTTNTAVTWSVNGVNGGNARTGTITAAGLYTAPAAVPSPATVTVRATSQQSATASGSAAVTIAPAPTSAAPAISSLSPASVTTGLAFTLTINGSGFVSGARIKLGAQEEAAAFLSATRLTMSGSISAAAGSTIPVQVVNPNGTVSNIVNLSISAGETSGGGSGNDNVAAARLLDQATFGPTKASIARVQQLGVEGWLQEQFNLPATQIPNTFGDSASALRAWQVHNFAHANDQLRQRVIYSLGQILVVSRDKLPYPAEIIPWMSLLSRHAFGNYKDLLREITILPSMGKYLDLANSAKPGVGGGANENYPRELLQLFSIGLWKLNPDGSQQATPAYSENDVRQIALALTGWTYPTAPGQQPRSENWEYFVGNMETREGNHDTSAKSFLGCTVPAGQTVVQDLDDVIDCVFQHPNVPPFIATRLIRSLVASNPSAAYISRVASVFADNGAGVRGDLKAVIKAILTDPEARNDTPTATSGRLREPILHVVAFGRALNAQISPSNQFTYIFDNMGQSALSPPSVFNWFSPLYRIPRTSYFGPEFQIYTPSQSVERANFFLQILTENFGDFRVDLSPFTGVAGNSAQLIDAVDNALLHGRMPQAMRDSLSRALAAAGDNQQRVTAALYLTALSGYYAVQH